MKRYSVVLSSAVIKICADVSFEGSNTEEPMSLKSAAHRSDITVLHESASRSVISFSDLKCM